MDRTNVNKIVLPLSSVHIANNKTIAVKLKKCIVNKLYDFPKYIKLSADNTSFVPTNFTTTIAETNGSTIVVISAPTVKTQYFAINICDLLFPLIISFFIALFWVNSVAIKNPANVLTIKLKNSGTVKKIKAFNSFKFANSNGVPVIY